MIELGRVTRRFGSTLAVDDVCLRVEEGTTTVLVGPSGCGKSTLLQMINGLLLADSGTVAVNGRPLTPSTAVQLRRDMGYVIQGGGLFPHLTARGNVTLMARWLGMDAGEREARVVELARLTQLSTELLDRYPGEISGGQAQRVALMRALMLDPSVLLLDEPLGALDPMVRADLQSELREIFRRLGKSVVLVTHDLSEAIYFADTIVLMRAGKVLQSGPPRQLLAAPADPFVERFVNAQRPVSWGEQAAH